VLLVQSSRSCVRRSGRSIFSRPRPIDLAARRAGHSSLDLDLEAEYDENSDHPLGRNPVLFDVHEDQPHRPPGIDVQFTDVPQAVAGRNPVLFDAHEDRPPGIDVKFADVPQAVAGRNHVLFDAHEERSHRPPGIDVQSTDPHAVAPATHDRNEEDAWGQLG